jgi:hypothetical protein
MREQLDSLKLACLLDLKHQPVPRPEALQPALRSVAAAFSDNVRRLEHQIDLPAFAITFARRFEHHLCLAIQEVRGRLVPIEPSAADRSVINDKFNQLLGAANRERQNRIGSISGQPLPPIVIEELRDGFHILSQLVAARAGIIQDGAPQMLASHITATWTIFETLAGDLWEAAINGHPSGLSGLHGKKRSSRSQREEKSIPLSQVERFRYDLTGCMGTILKDKFNFTVLDDIRDAYSAAFHKNDKEIDTALSDKSLDALNAVRNLIVHRAAIIDKRYRDQTKNLPLAPKGRIGERISLDGATVTGLLGAGLDRCNALIFAVNDWLERHAS